MVKHDKLYSYNIHDARTWPNVPFPPAFGGIRMPGMARGGTQVPEVASGNATHRHIHIPIHGAASLPTLSDLADGSDLYASTASRSKSEPSL